MKFITVRLLLFLVCGGCLFVLASAQEPSPWDKRFSYGDTIQVRKGIVFSQPDGKTKLALDLYRPAAPAAKLRPVILCFHGGGWEMGYRQLHHAHAEYFAAHGFVVATVSYRLRPAVDIDDCLNDAKAAVRWMRANAKACGADPNRIGTFGGSAGAHLSMMLALTADDPTLEGKGGNPGVSSRVQAAVGMATPANLQLKPVRKRFGLSMGLAKKLSPTEYFSKDDPPLFLLHCPKDRVVPYMSSSLLVHAAEMVGVSAKLETVEAGDHAFWYKENGFNQTMRSATAFFRNELAEKK